jgi:hypothetical protein
MRPSKASFHFQSSIQAFEIRKLFTIAMVGTASHQEDPSYTGVRSHYKTTFRGLLTLPFIFGFRKHKTGSLAHLGEQQMDNNFITLRKVNALNFDLEYNAL